MCIRDRFIIASAILYSSMYISAAIYGSGITSKSKEIFSTYLGFIGNGLIIPSIIPVSYTHLDVYKRQA